jgi:oxygen-independent coproporphyrinogen-3 oxidase
MPALQADSLVAPAGTPLYVHLPFCVVKCTYCDFYSVLKDGHDTGAFVDALLAEARVRAPRAPRTVFFGGGTPSFLAEGELVRVFEGLEELTGFRASAEEVTVECNPESLTPAKARLLRALGADRLSIGFQSLEPEILALFGRAHGVEQAFGAYDAARAAGFERVSVDLIYAVPGQRLERFEADLERVLALGPEHVSAYSLAFEEGTSFTRWLAEGRLEKLDEELELAFFERTRERLEQAGFEPYEISNFATSGEQCRHNVNYWRNGPYVGLGPSAVSKLGATRFGNPRSLQHWQREVGERSRAGAWEEELPPLGRLGETWWLGLRLREGVRPTAARARSWLTASDGAAPTDRDDPALALARELQARGWLEEHAGAWRLQRRALAVTDAVSARFLDLDAARTGRTAPRSNPSGAFLPAG